MKIICIGRNYHDHCAEMNNPVPSHPVFFMKPESALIYNDLPFFIPDFSNEIHHELELVIRIGKVGKNIPFKFAMSYIDAITVGLDLTARDIQRECIKNGEPWEIAKGFDGSAPMGKFIPWTEISDPSNINFRLLKNGVAVQTGNSKNMVFDFAQIISYISKYITLKTGDVIYSGTPAGVGPIEVDDTLDAYLEDHLLLSLKVK